MKKLVAIFMMVALSFLALPAHATTNSDYEDWGFARPNICIQTANMYSAWPADSVAYWWNKSELNVVARHNCADYGYARNQTVKVVMVNSSDYFCGKTAYWMKNSSGVYIATPTIWLNLYSKYYSGCRSNYFQRRHVLMHEMGHAIGLAHNSYQSVMNGWTYDKPQWKDYDLVARRYPW